MDLIKSVNKTVAFYAKFEHKRIFKNYTPQQLGVWTKREIATMGPSFIKIGQFVSTRSDVFGKEFTDELKDLQDNIASLTFDTVREYIPVHIENIDPVPIASASIGQVYRGKLSGEDIVVKIKRPDIDAQIRSDFSGLLFFIRALKLISNDRRLVEFEILFTEYYNLLREEIDFKKELQNIKMFENLFRKTPWIKVPKVYEKFSDENCIVMEYVPSMKIDDIENIKKQNFDTQKIAAKLVECYVDQIIRYGYVHIDPHPGNIGITRGGKLVFYDYGMVVVLDNKIQNHFDELLIALYDKDVDQIATLAIEIGLVVVDSENLSYFKKFLIFFLSYMEKMNVDDFKLAYLDNITPSDTPFLISSKFLLLMRGLSILEGNCKLLDPLFNYKKNLDPYIEDFLVDIKYIENKALLDINAMQKIPTKLKEQEIELEIMRKNAKNTLVAQKNKLRYKLLAGIILICNLEYISEPVYLGLLTIIMSM